jgi:thioredoxin-related protein
MKINILIIAIFLSFLNIGCDNKSSKAKIIHVDKTINSTKEQNIKLSKKATTIVQNIFQDTAKIQPNNKYMILIFGANTDPYTAMLKEDISKSKIMQDRLKNDFSSYYF